jgi:UDP-N-acetylglucosamine 2-epimerase (non-hydrolysing)
MRIDIIAGARPNFMKIAPIIDSILRVKTIQRDISYRLIHTGQHYDNNMSENFFRDLNIPKPDFNLNCGGGSHAEQTGNIMLAYEQLLNNDLTKRDLCIVVGDVNSTLACSIVAKKNGLKVAHIESGLRSNDFTMPEEINRVVTDSITDFHFTTSVIASNNLLNEGVSEEKIFFVGNTMIDTLLKNKKRFRLPRIWNEFNLKNKNFLVLTMHRPSNVDDKNRLNEIISFILNNSKNRKIIFPVHPRTKKNIAEILNFPNLILIDPMSYLEFMYLVKRALAVITDSGGLSEETTVLDVPCITLRDNTERPETVDLGTNVLVGSDLERLGVAISSVFNQKLNANNTPKLWDGMTSERIIKTLLSQNF